MNDQKPKKLILHQETLRALTSSPSQKTAGMFITGLPHTCPECASPPQTLDC